MCEDRFFWAGSISKHAHLILLGLYGLFDLYLFALNGSKMKIIIIRSGREKEEERELERSESKSEGIQKRKRTSKRLLVIKNDIIRR